MEEIGDWIYILVIIIAGVASLISSTRKKARQMAGQNQQPRKVTTDQNEEEDFRGVFTSQTEMKPEHKAHSNQQAKPAFSTVKNYHTPFFDIHQGRQTSMQATEAQSAVAVEGYATISVDDLPDNTDEWRKAFIYNEIFSRKN